VTFVSFEIVKHKLYFDVQFGLMQMVAHEEALTILARSIDPRDPTCMLEAVKLMAAICLVPPDGQVFLLYSVY